MLASGRCAAGICCGCPLRGIDNLEIASTAAEIPAQCHLDLLVRRTWILLQQRFDRQDHPRCAVATLECMLLLKRSLYRVISTQTLCSGNLAALSQWSQEDAR